MPRSAGITISAVVAIIGSVFTLFGAAMMVAGAFALPKLSPAASFPGDVRFFYFVIVFVAIVWFGFGCWGLASGIGLLRLKHWARISILVFAGLLIFFSLPPAVFMPLLPLPNSNEPNLPSNFMAIMRVGLTLFYLAFAALGGFWLYFFNKRSVKAQFQGEQASGESAAPQLPLGTPIFAPSGAHGVRPLSITIIGWFLIIGSAFSPLVLLFNKDFFSSLFGQPFAFPLFFLGFFFFGRSASLILGAWGVAQFVGAVGLLKLRRWGLFTTIGLQCMVLVNSALLIGIPADRARFQQIMEAMISSLNAQWPTPMPLEFPVWVGFASALPMVSVILWFLITRRRAFTSSTEQPILQD